MENKENYNTIIQDLSSNITSSFYDNLSTYNVITINDTNDLLSGINYCISVLTTICSDEFCQLCLNSVGYYITITDEEFPRVKYFNGITKDISATFLNSKINNTFLSSTPQIPINLLTYREDLTFTTVDKINEHGKGNLTGVEKVTINGNTFAYKDSNNGIINLGNYKLIDFQYVTSINGLTGNLVFPVGIATFDDKYYKCNSEGKVKLSDISIFSSYVNIDHPTFTNLRVNSVIESNPSSVINLEYLKKKTNETAVYCTTIYTEHGISLPDGTYKINVPRVNDSNFLSYIYGIQNNNYKEIVGFNNKGEGSNCFETDLYKNGVPLTFVILEGDVNVNYKLKLLSSGSPDAVTMLYSYVYKPYESLTDEGVVFKKGLPVSLSCSTTTFSKTSADFYYFQLLSGTGANPSSPCNPKFICYGNVMSLVNWKTDIENNYQFYALFSGSNIIKTPVLPATTLTNSCYEGMFYQCSSLLVPPQLPAIEMKDSCYAHMFEECTALKTFPVLPAEILAPSCYMRMFYHCTSLKFAPYYLLPATGMVNDCYRDMFMACTHLTDSPLLPAKTLANNCYYRIFNGCDALTAVHADLKLSDIGDTYTYHWLTRDTHPSTIFYNTEAWNDCYYGNFTIKNSNCMLCFYYNLDNTAGTLITDQHFRNGYYDKVDREIKQIGRSLLDTELSFELTWKGDNNDPAFCFRALSCQVSSSSGFTNFKNFIFNKTHIDVLPALTTDWPKQMKVKYKKYDKGTLKSKRTDSSDGWDDIGLKNTAKGDYTLSHKNNLTTGNVGMIFSVKGTKLNPNKILTRKVKVNKEIVNVTDTLVFWRLCHTKNVKLRILGNICSLINNRTNLEPFEFFSIFSNDTCGTNHFTTGYVDAHQLVLPAKKLANNCYANMFEQCSSLINGPTSLPAEELAPSCYLNMFANCTSLSSGPNINATILADRSCDWIFVNSKLRNTPSFNSIKIGDRSALKAAFYKCYQLSCAQDFALNNIEEKQCSELFKNCYKLKYPSFFTSNSIGISGCSNAYSTCSSLLYVPPLSMTLLNNSCYYQMFTNCSGLVSKYTYLPASNLTPSCYQGTFSGTNINYITVKFTDWKNASRSTYNWFKNYKEETGTVFCYPELNILKDNGEYYIPSGWSVESSLKGVNLIFSENISLGDIQLFYLMKKS